MVTVESGRRNSPYIWLIRLSGSAIVAAYLGPHLLRLAHPSVYGDDITRIWNLQNLPTWQLLFAPFNEHVAPVFDSVSWVAWALSRHRLSIASQVFTIASFVPFVLVLYAIAAFAKRELGSWEAAIFALAVFAIAPIHVVETVWWYSGSNHMWALLGLMVALIGARNGQISGACITFAGCLLSPACSAMGVISGPAVAVWALSEHGRGRKRIAFAALAGTAFYLSLASAIGLVSAVSYGFKHHTNISLGLLTVAQAPSVVLLPALAGIRDLDLRTPAAVSIAISVVLVVILLAFARRSPNRSLILLGLVLIFGEYLLIYPFRVRDGSAAALRIARFHLFPQLGVALVLATLLRRALNSSRGPIIAICAGILLLVTHLPQMFTDARLYEFPNQANTFAAMERVQAIATDQGITRGQILDALEPVQPRWLPIDRRDANVLRLLAPTVESSDVPNWEVRSKILAGLIAPEREGLFGSADVSKYLVSATNRKTSWEVPSHRVQSQNLEATTTAGVFESKCPFAYQEFAWDDSPDRLDKAQTLVVSARDKMQGVEVWWADENDQWSEGRSVRWRISPDSKGPDWAIPLERLPNWDRHRTRHIRIQFRYPGVVWLEPPKLIREESTNSRRHTLQ